MTLLKRIPLRPLSEGTVEGLYRAHAPAAFSLARRILGDDSEALDITQETFIEVTRSIGAFRGDGSMRGWICRIAASKALMLLRRSGRLTLDNSPPECVSDMGSGRRLELAAAFEQLPPLSRSVVWLHDVEGYTHEEIAALVGKTPSFSKSQLSRAHLRLRSLLEGSP